jgi:mannosyl-oligosaccharide alpha-1,2-mannosidase
MISLRRYVVYLGAVIFIVFFFSYLRRTSISGPTSFFNDEGDTADWPWFTANKHFRWDEVEPRYPVVSVTPLPTDKPLQLPKVQHEFEEEDSDHAKLREKRRASVKAAFQRCWKEYRDRAWMKDELSPLTGGSSDNFGGWAASLVDSLDTLWIMGMKSEFQEAVKAAITIDLRKSTQEQINVFETTIRHLGGFLAAYDLSGDERLLKKAKEFGDMLIVAFDTPNRMPITRWYPRNALHGTQRADAFVLAAEIGSLTMEFTRLSLLTGESKWYDAVERIVTLLAEQQLKTKLPGMWPVTVNAETMDFTGDTLFTLSAMSDSLYEYLPKMHALLGGVDSRYSNMYELASATAVDNNLFRPMTPDNADILMSGSVRKLDTTSKKKLDTQGQHLACFAGGMFALGGKLLDKPEHIQFGKRLTKGCIWAYNALPLGVMPEVFRMVPCESKFHCSWNETKWKERVAAENKNSGNVDDVIKKKRLPPGFTDIPDRRYILRPEAIESVFLLYRMTGEKYLQEAAWKMFNAIMDATTTPLANAALKDVTFTKELVKGGKEVQENTMESFWMVSSYKSYTRLLSSV